MKLLSTPGILLFFLDKFYKAKKQEFHFTISRLHSKRCISCVKSRKITFAQLLNLQFYFSNIAWFKSVIFQFSKKEGFFFANFENQKTTILFVLQTLIVKKQGFYLF